MCVPVAPVVRVVIRKKLHLGLLSPRLGNAASPDVLVLNILPYADDLRGHTFPPLNAKPDMVPSMAQVGRGRLAAGQSHALPCMHSCSRGTESGCPVGTHAALSRGSASCVVGRMCSAVTHIPYYYS